MLPCRASFPYLRGKLATKVLGVHVEARNNQSTAALLSVPFNNMENKMSVDEVLGSDLKLMELNQRREAEMVGFGQVTL